MKIYCACPENNLTPDDEDYGGYICPVCGGFLYYHIDAVLSDMAVSYLEPNPVVWKFLREWNGSFPV